MTLKPWKVIRSHHDRSYRVFTIRTDRAVSPRTREAHDFYVLESDPWVNVIPITEDNQIILVQQYRHGLKTVTLEIPGGLVENGESPLEAAKKELRQETGYEAAEWIELGSVHPNPAIQSNSCFSFVAKGAHNVGELELDEREDIEVVLKPLAQVPRLIREGSITHSLILAAFYKFYMEYLPGSLEENLLIPSRHLPSSLEVNPLMPPRENYRYCPRCGGPLSLRVIKPPEPQRLFCESCRFVLYLDPKVAAGVIVEVDGGIVLLKRGIPPEYGKWVIPGGFVDLGETVPAAAARECLEEVGLKVRVAEPVGVYSYQVSPVIVVIYRAEYVSGTVAPGDEALEATVFPPSAIPWKDLAFQSTKDALKEYLGSTVSHIK
jgi:ADP-ribose pyrophosphatase YjhB (NUDIX family)